MCDNIDIFWPDARQEKKIGWRSGRASYPIGERIISEKAAGKPNSFEKAVSDRNTNLSLSLSYSFSLPLLAWRVQVATTCAALSFIFARFVFGKRFGIYHATYVSLMLMVDGTLGVLNDPYHDAYPLVSLFT